MSIPRIQYQKYYKFKNSENTLESEIQSDAPLFDPYCLQGCILESQMQKADQAKTKEETPSDEKIIIAPENNPHSSLLENISFGLGLAHSDFFPLELSKRWNPFLMSKIYYAFPFPFRVQVEYTQGVLANEGKIIVENPDLNVGFLGTLGPQYGIDLAISPFAGNFFVSLGYGYRKLSLEGSLSSYLILRSAAGSIATNSEIDLHASAWVKQDVARIYLGWNWDVFSGLAYLTLIPIGYNFPVNGRSSVSLKANLVNPKATSPTENVILERAEREFEQDLEEQTKADVQAVEMLGTPIIGLIFGFHLS